MRIRRDNRQRVWEIDALRGLMIVCMLATHLYYCVDEFCIDGFYHINSYRWVEITDPLHFWFDWGEDGVIHQAFLTPEIQHLWILAGVDGFFFVSGVSCCFSRDNMRSTIRLLIAGCFMTLFTYGLYLWTGDSARFMRFGPLMCYAFSHLIFTLFFENRSSKTLIAVAIPVLVAGYLIRYVPICANTLLLFPLGIHPQNMTTGEYTPLLPMLGWILLGVVFGRRFYSTKKSLCPINKIDRATRWMQWFGRYSGYIYIGHILLYTFVFTIIGHFLNIL